MAYAEFRVDRGGNGIAVVATVIAVPVVFAGFKLTTMQ